MTKATSRPPAPAQPRAVPGPTTALARRPLLAALAAATLGVLHAASFAPWPAWWLQLASLGGLFALWAHAAVGAPLRTRLAIAGGFGLGWFVAGVCWLYVSMHDYGGLPAPIAATAVVLVGIYLSLYPGAALLICGDALAGPRPLAGTLRLAGAWTLAEWLRGLVFTGFPWLSTGYAQIDGPLAGFAPVLGVYGIGGLTAWVAAALALLARMAVDRYAHPARATPVAADAARDTGDAVAGPSSAVVALAGIVVLSLGGFALGTIEWSRPHGDPIRVRLLQGNVPQSMKFDALTARRAMAMYTDMALAAKADLTVLPETAWTVPWAGTPPDIAQRLTTPGGNAHPLAIGLPAFTGSAGAGGYPQLANSVMLLQPGQDPERAPRYDKRHLVPFGEFIPPMFGWFVNLMNIPLGSFGRGRDDQPAFEVAGQRLGFDICYEDLFGEELLPQVREPVGATILVNVSNIGWFGRSHALPQHLAIARMRAMETARPMLRATNTGMTASIDARGRVRLMLEPFSIGTLEDTVQGTTGLTPYARVGNAAALGLALLAIAASVLRRRNR